MIFDKDAFDKILETYSQGVHAAFTRAVMNILNSETAAGDTEQNIANMINDMAKQSRAEQERDTTDAICLKWHYDVDAGWILIDDAAERAVAHTNVILDTSGQNIEDKDAPEGAIYFLGRHYEHEVVNSEALGKVFQYCRTCKVEV